MISKLTETRISLSCFGLSRLSKWFNLGDSSLTRDCQLLAIKAKKFSFFRSILLATRQCIIILIIKLCKYCLIKIKNRKIIKNLSLVKHLAILT